MKFLRLPNNTVMAIESNISGLYCFIATNIHFPVLHSQIHSGIPSNRTNLVISQNHLRENKKIYILQAYPKDNTKLSLEELPTNLVYFCLINICQRFRIT
jgi:hypothetical protein